MHYALCTMHYAHYYWIIAYFQVPGSSKLNAYFQKVLMIVYVFIVYVFVWVYSTSPSFMSVSSGFILLVL